jgi:spermidine synthase
LGLNGEKVFSPEKMSKLPNTQFQRVLPELVALRTEPPLQHADEGFQAEMAAERERLLGFYEAGLYAYNGQRERWASTLRRVLAEDGNNPYYRWIVEGN